MLQTTFGRHRWRGLLALAVASALALPGPATANITPTDGALLPEPDDPVTQLVEVPDRGTDDEDGTTQRVAPMDATRYALISPGGWSPLRNDYQSLVIGNGKSGWMIDAVWHDDTDGYVGGFVHGGTKFSNCGWVKTDKLTVGRGRPVAECDANNGRIPTNAFAGLINCSKCNGPTGVGITRLAGYAYGFRNIRPWRARSGGGGAQPTDLVRWKPSAKVGWRYVTPDNQWVLISDPALPGGANSVFVPRILVRAFSRALPGGPLTAMCKRNERPVRVVGARRADWPAVCDAEGTRAGIPEDPADQDPVASDPDPDPTEPTCSDGGFWNGSQCVHHL